MYFISKTQKKRRYDLLDIIGRGGFSEVYRAYDRVLKCDVAIKVSPRVRDSPAEHEAKVGRDLRHPSVIRQLDAFSSRKHHYIVFELLEGPEMFARIVERDHLPEDEARLATSALVDAIAYLHSNGIIHRDIKPENVIYRSRDAAPDDFVLADFGLAAYVSEEEGDVVHGHAGSPGYTSPEMLEGKGAGRSTDIWSLGLVVYALLSGRTPFVSTDPLELNEECRRARIAYPTKYWEHVSDEGRDFVERCLQRNPRQRMTIDDCIHHPWLTSGLYSSPSASSLASVLFERRPSDGSVATSYCGSDEGTLSTVEKKLVPESPGWMPML